MRDTTFYFVFVAVVISSASASGTFGSCPGGDWVAFEDSKCFKLLRTFTDGHGSAGACQAEGNGSNLYRPATIKTQMEQDFITHYVFNESAVVSSVWFGLKANEDGEFVWVDDGSQPVYTNWGDGSPGNDPSKNCVELESRLSRVEDGDWKDVPCQRANYVLCETLQTWAIDELQAAVLSLRLELAASNSKIDDHQGKIEDQKTEISESRERISVLEGELGGSIGRIGALEANPVPIGFIYIQLPRRSSPQTLWPRVTWQDVTSNYSGQFFRAEGGNAAPFGTYQSSSSPRLTQVKYYDDPDTVIVEDTSVVSGSWSSPVRSGKFHGGEPSPNDKVALQFLVSSGETRPENTAVKIWMRVE